MTMEIPKWPKEAFQPVYWILRDRQLNSLVIAVRGTFSMSDIISDVCLGPRGPQGDPRGDPRGPQGTRTWSGLWLM